MGLENKEFDSRQIDQHLARIEANAFVKHSVRIFREYLNRFLSGETDFIDLFKADYTATGDNVAKIKVPNVDYSIEEIKLVRKFMQIPRPETQGLKQYAQDNPDTKVALLNFAFNINNPLEGIENIFHKRFKDPNTGHLISSVWTAIRYSPDSEYGPKEVQRRIKITPKSHVAILRPPAGVSRVR